MIVLRKWLNRHLGINSLRDAWEFTREIAGGVALCGLAVGIFYLGVWSSIDVAEPNRCVDSCKATVDRIIDGDTVVINVPLGLDVFQSVTVRLAGIDTPELRGDNSDAGTEAKNFASEWLGGERASVVFTDHGAGKFYRRIGTIRKINGGQSLSDALLHAGHIK